MTAARRWLVVVTLCIVAVGLASHFVEYRTEAKNVLVEKGLLLLVRERLVEPDPYAEPKPPPGFKIVLQEGIYARHGYTVLVAAIGGL
jgi:hypothetical protein